MDETPLRTTEQLKDFLREIPDVAFTGTAVDGAAANPRYAYTTTVGY